MCGNCYAKMEAFLRNSNRTGAFWLLLICMMIVGFAAFRAGPFRETAHDGPAAAKNDPSGDDAAVSPVPSPSTVPSPPFLTASAKSGFYTEDLAVSLEVLGDTTGDLHIYYTVNGDEASEEPLPSEDPSASEAVPPSEDPSASEAAPPSEATDVIHFPLDGASKIYTLKAALYEGDTCRDRLERTYILGPEIASYYDLDIVCVSSDAENLYDYETGIMVYGAEYEREMRNGEDGVLMGNMGEDWTRDAHVTMFSPDGTVLLDDDCGLSLSGGTSRLMDTKSLMLTAGRGISPSDNRFRISLYGDSFSENDPEECVCSFVSEYKRLRLRSGAQDLVDSNIRSSVVSRLAAESDFYGCTPTRRVIVFLNGEFYSVADMQASYTDTFLGDRFSLPDDQLIEKNKGSEEGVLSRFDVRGLFQADLSRRENREALEQAVDMDDYLRYYAVQILTGNTDWPDNNYEAWRYLGPAVSGNPYTDGRLRFLIFDTDLTWYQNGRIDFFEGATGDTFASIMEGTNRAAGSLFAHVMESEEYRSRFLAILTGLMDGPFAKTHVLQVIDEETERIRRAQETFFTAEQTAAWEEHVAAFRSAAEVWSDTVKEDLLTYFGTADTVRWQIACEDGVVVHTLFGTAGGEKTLAKRLLRGISVELLAEASPGHAFSGWSVNGTEYEGETLTLTPEMIGENVRFVRITARAEALDGRFIRIDRACRRGTDDWFEIINCGQEEVLLSNYCISDDPDRLFKCRLPAVYLAPGELIRIYGSKSLPGIGDYVCNFSLSEGEALYLTSNADGSTGDVLPLPVMQAGESCGRYLHGSSWRFRKE